MTLETLVENSAATLGLPGLTFTRNKSCEFIIGGKLLVVIEAVPAEEAVYLYTVLGRVPETGREAFYAALLGAQLFHAKLGEGCCFGLDEETHEIILNRKLTTDGLNEEAFLSALNEFANWAEYWIKEFGNLAAPADHKNLPEINTTFFVRA